MSVTGPARPSLTAQLQEKLRSDREQTEAIASAELAKLAESLSRSSKAALDAIETDTIAQVRRLQNDLDRIGRPQKLWPLWTALSCIAIAAALFALLWMATSWKRSELHELIDGTSAMRATLDDLRQMTGGLRIVAMETGFPVLGMPYDPADLYRCGADDEMMCLELDPAKILTGPQPEPRPSGTPATPAGTE